jgi:hypothetical protein
MCDSDSDVDSRASLCFPTAVLERLSRQCSNSDQKDCSVKILSSEWGPSSWGRANNVAVKYCRDPPSLHSFLCLWWYHWGLNYPVQYNIPARVSWQVLWASRPPFQLREGKQRKTRCLSVTDVEHAVKIFQTSHTLYAEPRNRTRRVSRKSDKNWRR